MDAYNPKHREIKDPNGKEIFDPKYKGSYDPTDIDLYDLKNIDAYDFKNMSSTDIKNLEIYNWGMSLRDPGTSTTNTLQSIGGVEGRCVLQFNDFLLEYLKDVQLKITLEDESGKVRAYHYVTLLDLHRCSKRGSNLWLSMTLKQEDKKKFPLLHLSC